MFMSSHDEAIALEGRDALEVRIQPVLDLYGKHILPELKIPAN